MSVLFSKIVFLFYSLFGSADSPLPDGVLTVAIWKVDFFVVEAANKSRAFQVTPDMCVHTEGHTNSKSARAHAHDFCADRIQWDDFLFTRCLDRFTDLRPTAS